MEGNEDQDTSPPLLLWTMQQVAAALQISRTKVNELIYREKLPIVRLGNRVRISPISLQQWLEQREQENNPTLGGVPEFSYIHAWGYRIPVTAIHTLVQALIGDEREMRPLLTKAFRQMGNIAVSELEQVLHTSKGDQRRRIVTLLKQIGTPEALVAIEGKLRR